MQKAQQKCVLRPELLKIRGSGKGKLPLCAGGSVCSARGVHGEQHVPDLCAWICGCAMALIWPCWAGAEVSPPAFIHDPPMLPICCGCCTAPAGPFFLFFFPFFLWLSCRNASAAFWSRATNTSMSSRVQFRICCEDRNPRDQCKVSLGYAQLGAQIPGPAVFPGRMHTSE